MKYKVTIKKDDEVYIVQCVEEQKSGGRTQNCDKRKTKRKTKKRK